MKKAKTKNNKKVFLFIQMRKQEFELSKIK